MSLNYDDWKSGWYERSYERDPEDEYVNLRDIPDQQDVKQLIRDVITHLYSDGTLKIDELDEKLCRLSELFGVNIPDHLPKIFRT